MSTHWPCDPVFRPSPGDEDKIRHSNTKDCWFYVVGKGHVNGIYTDSHVARRQVDRFSGSAWKKAATWDLALKTWADFCRLYHQHTPVPVIDLSPSPSPSGSRIAHPSPPPSPSPSPSPPPYETIVGHAAHPAAGPPRRRTAALVAPTATLAAVNPTRAAASMEEDAAPSRRREGAASSRSRQRRVLITQVPSSAVQWQEGDRLHAVEGVPCLFETRYDAVDYVFENHLHDVGFLETRNRRKLAAFILRRPYVRRAGDPEDSE
ncbi:hypothetical protein B0H11DRAFT_2259953 [Mycena galericulata]|nr:hypothetical protein B0H11DRAFT_2259953 [Mycena galericulata]